MNNRQILNCLAVADQRQHSGAVWPSVLYERTQELQVTHPKCHMQPQHHPPIILQGEDTTLLFDLTTEEPVCSLFRLFL